MTAVFTNRAGRTFDLERLHSRFSSRTGDVCDDTMSLLEDHGQKIIIRHGS